MSMRSPGFDEWVSGGTALADSLVEFHCLVDDEFSPGGPESTFLTPAQILSQVALLDPGPDAIGLLNLLDEVPLTRAQALTLAGEWERQSRWITARQRKAMVGFAGPARTTAATTVPSTSTAIPATASRDAERAEASDILELGLTLDVGPDLTRTQLAQARQLHGPLAGTGRALELGEVSVYRARRITEALAGLTADLARQIEAAILPDAGTVSLRTLTRRLRTAVLKAQGPKAADEYATGAADRRVVLDREADQPGLLGPHAYLPPEQTLAIRDTLQAKAEELKTADRTAREAAKGRGVAVDQLPVRRRQ